jgi:hypothetical protein
VNVILIWYSLVLMKARRPDEFPQLVYIKHVNKRLLVKRKPKKTTKVTTISPQGT